MNMKMNSIFGCIHLIYMILGQIYTTCIHTASNIRLETLSCCKNIFTGYSAGSNWDSSGAATNFICLVKDPYLIGNNSFNKGAQVWNDKIILFFMNPST